MAGGQQALIGLVAAANALWCRMALNTVGTMQLRLQLCLHRAGLEESSVVAACVHKC